MPVVITRSPGYVVEGLIYGGGAGVNNYNLINNALNTYETVVIPPGPNVAGGGSNVYVGISQTLRIGINGSNLFGFDTLTQPNIGFMANGQPAVFDAEGIIISPATDGFTDTSNPVVTGGTVVQLAQGHCSLISIGVDHCTNQNSLPQNYCVVSSAGGRHLLHGATLLGWKQGVTINSISYPAATAATTAFADLAGGGNVGSASTIADTHIRADPTNAVSIDSYDWMLSNTRLLGTKIFTGNCDGTYCYGGHWTLGVVANIQCASALTFSAIYVDSSYPTTGAQVPPGEINQGLFYTPGNPIGGSPGPIILDGLKFYQNTTGFSHMPAINHQSTGLALQIANCKFVGTNRTGRMNFFDAIITTGNSPDTRGVDSFINCHIDMNALYNTPAGTASYANMFPTYGSNHPPAYMYCLLGAVPAGSSLAPGWHSNLSVTGAGGLQYP